MSEPKVHAVDVVLPCLDEAAALPGVLAGLPDGCRAVVVDNGSRDGSPEVARRCGAEVVREPVRGYGAAVHAGLLASRAEIVCVADCDGSIDLGELPVLVEAVRRREVDLAVGRRVARERSSFPWHSRAGNAVLAAALRRRGVPVRDLAPVRVGRRLDLLGVDVTDRGFGYPLELLTRIGRSGWNVGEFPVSYYPRAVGTRSKVTGSLPGTVRAVRDMLGVLR